MNKPIASIDIESTGLDIAKDRIITLAVVTRAPNGTRSGDMLWTVNPGIPIPKEATDVHGITDEAVAHLPGFSYHAKTVLEWISGHDLVGFNLLNFDIPMLWEEFFRAGIEWDLSGVNLIDAGNIFKKKEERTLSAAVRFYCGRDHGAAHDARADAEATLDVFDGQLSRYQDLAAMDVGGLSEFSRFDKRFDLAGKIVADKDGDPSYAIGKAKGTKVRDDVGFAYWMLDRDFTANTKSVLNKILEDIETEGRSD